MSTAVDIMENALEETLDKTYMFSTLEDALAFIHDAAYRGGKNGLYNMSRLMGLLGEPHKRLRCLHVAGTNGKGSVCAFLQAALRVAGYRTGLYTSPYLERFNERVRIDGAPISDNDLVRYANKVAGAVYALRGQGVYPTEFEITTAIGFLYLADNGVDVAVVEVGLGGRFDSTNVITPLCACITSIGLDHTKTLGDTVEKIAFEKAGIAKAGVPMVLYPDAPEGVTRVVAEVCGSIGTKLIRLCADDVDVDDIDVIGGGPLGLSGRHQARNAAVARAMLKASGLGGIDDACIAEGFARTRWPGRLERVDYTHDGRAVSFLLDGAHNPHASAVLSDYIVEKYGEKAVVAIVGMLREKDAAGSAAALANAFAMVCAVAPDSSRALSAVDLANIYEAAGVAAHACASLREAVDIAAAHAGGAPIVVTGSLYLVGEARALLNAPECTLLGDKAGDEGDGGDG